jgi:hypothetical protein
VQLPVSLHVYQDSGGGLRVVSAPADPVAAINPAVASTRVASIRVAVILIMMSPLWLEPEAGRELLPAICGRMNSFR